jgi:hypothetical protein
MIKINKKIKNDKYLRMDGLSLSMHGWKSLIRQGGGARTCATTEK